MEPARILLIDDDASVARALGLALEVIGGFTVRTEPDGNRAADVAREFRPDLILLDVVASNWDGGQVAGELGRDSDLSSIPIAFLTALVDETR